MLNVLQAMILTKDEKMVLTPTYHVFEMFKSYQDGTALPVEIQSAWYNKDGSTLPAVSASAVPRQGRPSAHRAGECESEPAGERDGADSRWYRSRRYKARADRGGD